MSNPHTIPERLQGATGLRAVLAAAYDAFEFLLAVIRDHQDLDEDLFTAFVMSGVCAADGRDALAAAPSLPWPPPVEQAGAVNDFRSGSAGEIAADLAALSQAIDHTQHNAARSLRSEKDALSSHPVAPADPLAVAATSRGDPRQPEPPEFEP